MEVTARYNDGTSEAVTGYTYAPSGALSTNDTKVTVTYAGKTAVVTITVTTSDLNKTITGVQPLDLIRVPKGTSREKLPLPSEVLVTLSNGAALSCPFPGITEIQNTIPIRVDQLLTPLSVR